MQMRVGLPYSVLPFAERTIFGFGCKCTIGAWIHACNTTMQYEFVLHCCDVMALCRTTASKISNKITVRFVNKNYAKSSRRSRYRKITDFQRPLTNQSPTSATVYLISRKDKILQEWYNPAVKIINYYRNIGAIMLVRNCDSSLY